MDQTHTLITPKEALKILTWVSASGLYIGSRGTKKLTKFPVAGSWLYSKEECEQLRDEILKRGIVYSDKVAGLKPPMELV